MDQAVTVGDVRNVVDKHFCTRDKETFLTFMDNKLPDGAIMIGALEDLGVKITSNSTTVVLQSGNDQSLNFEGHTGKLWQCETCDTGFTRKNTFGRSHAIGLRKSHKLLKLFDQPSGLGDSRESGYVKPRETLSTDLKINHNLGQGSLLQRYSNRPDAHTPSGRFFCIFSPVLSFLNNKINSC